MVHSIFSYSEATPFHCDNIMRVMPKSFSMSCLVLKGDKLAVDRASGSSKSSNSTLSSVASPSTPANQ